ncbi:MLP-like protein 28 [Humulus lupulus]|uniref:MLP-like protein 28 n=1 Tax=Humulus lupulus TaxID=3486 RepID=UPI002B402BA2|nr:MLP-like protein 28 [Humulus lupulus]
MATTTTNDLKGKVEIDIDIKAPPTKFYHMFKKTAHHVPHCAGNHIQGVDVHEGDWESHGSIKVWKYTVDGKEESFKEKVELDDENNKVTLIGIEGDVFKHYKCFKPVYHAVPKGEGSLVKLSIEYEKLDASVPPPNKYLDMMVGITKDIDSHFEKGAPVPSTRTVIW